MKSSRFNGRGGVTSRWGSAQFALVFLTSGCTGVVLGESSGGSGAGARSIAPAAAGVGGASLGGPPGDAGGNAESGAGTGGASPSLAGSAGTAGAAGSPPNVALPSGYRTWPPFLLNVQRTDNLQVRDIYINALGAAAQRGAPFPQGTVMVMDLLDVQKDATGTAVKDSAGALIKTSLLKTYVMEKELGWGNTVSADLRNGDWLYAAYASDGVTQLKDSTAACFSCHVPLGPSLDWVQRYDEYFMHRDPPVVPPSVALPQNYRSFPAFLLNVQRADVQQVRDIYINAIGSATQSGAPFVDGTVLVMDLFDVKKDSKGNADKDSNGALSKSSLLKTYVIEKRLGWGDSVPADQRNGDWLYAAYASDGVTQITDPTTSCFACHLPLGANVDWVQRYDDYFEALPTPP